MSCLIALGTMLSAVGSPDRLSVARLATADRLVMVEAEKAQKESPAKSDSAKEKKAARLKQIMVEWEKKASAIRDIRFRFKMILEDKTFGEREVQIGDAAGRKPDLVRINVKTDKGIALHTTLFTREGVDCYVYEKRRVLALPPPPPGHRRRFGDLGFLAQMAYIFGGGWIFDGPSLLADALYQYKPLVLGFDPKALNVRYRVELLKEDAYYVYIGLRPRDEKEDDECEWMTLALDKNRFVARLIQVYAVNENRFLYLDDVETNVTPPITAESLQKGLPQGWERSPRIEWKLVDGKWTITPKSP